jgi:hypothetical protein
MYRYHIRIVKATGIANSCVRDEYMSSTATRRRPHSTTPNSALKRYSGVSVQTGIHQEVPSDASWLPTAIASHPTQQ